MKPLSAGSTGVPMRIAMLGTYPPTRCGLATFGAALAGSLRAGGHHVDVVRVLQPGEDAESTDDVVGMVMPDSTPSRRRAIRHLNEANVAIIQHEFGIYPGTDGSDVLSIVDGLDVPAIVVLHTVPWHSTAEQARILVELCQRATRVVVMSESARECLVTSYFPVDECKVEVIPHGAIVVAPSGQACQAPTDLLSWGLLGPGKGIEHVLEGLGYLRRHGLPLTYTIAGETHPKVRGEHDDYRRMLKDLARQHHITDAVHFDETYRSPADLATYVSSFPLVIMAYDNEEQVTSGVLVDTLAAGTPVVATAFPHAIELLSSGAGVLVPHRDTEALAVAMWTSVSDGDQQHQMRRRAREVGSSLGWPDVAQRYAQVCRDLVSLDVAS